MVLNPEHRQLLADGGWSKRDVSPSFESATGSLADLKRSGRLPGKLQPGEEERADPFVRQSEDRIRELALALAPQVANLLASSPDGTGRGLSTASSGATEGVSVGGAAAPVADSPRTAGGDSPAD